ncbi:MAG: hypothetical protein ABEI77_03630 [Halorientalis sp.]
MRRRTLLSLCGACTVGLTGCLSESGRDQPTTADQSTDEVTSTDDTADGGSAAVSVAVDALQPGVITRISPDSIGVGDDDGQYLYLTLDVTSGESPAPDEFAFAFDGQSHSPYKTSKSYPLYRTVENQGSRYDAEDGVGWLLFELPGSGDATNARFTWPGGEWRPDEMLRNRLAAPAPPLSVSVDVPETIERNSSPTLSVTITNDGDLPGRFVAGLNRSGPRIAYAPLARLTTLVTAGETKTVTYTDDGIYWSDNESNGEASGTYHLNWPGGDADQEFTVES